LFQSFAELRWVRYVAPVFLLMTSNVFMTFAWYWHLKYKSKPLLLVIVLSWSIAFFEYCFAVPANRIGYGVYSAAELKTIQEVITLSVFAVFSMVYLGETFRPQQALGFLLIAAGAYLVFHGAKSAG
jgi:uncharacterized protein (DUF486 family)